MIGLELTNKPKSTTLRGDLYLVDGVERGDREPDLPFEFIEPFAVR
jgi:hypothetical protein